MTKFVQEPSWVAHGSPNKFKMAAAAIFNFGKMSILPVSIKISALNFMATGRMYHGHAEMTM